MSVTNCNVYVARMPPHYNDQKLLALASQFGHVLSARAMPHKQTGLCKGYGFILFAAPESAAVSIQALNGVTMQDHAPDGSLVTFTLEVRYAHVEATDGRRISDRPGIGHASVAPVAPAPAAPMVFAPSQGVPMMAMQPQPMMMQPHQSPTNSRRGSNQVPQETMLPVPVSAQPTMVGGQPMMMIPQPGQQAQPVMMTPQGQLAFMPPMVAQQQQQTVVNNHSISASLSSVGPHESPAVTSPSASFSAKSVPTIVPRPESPPPPAQMSTSSAPTPMLRLHNSLVNSPTNSEQSTLGGSAKIISPKGQMGIESIGPLLDSLTQGTAITSPKNTFGMTNAAPHLGSAQLAAEH